MIFSNEANLCGVDSLGRVLPKAGEVPAPKKRIVALFYYLWLGQHGTEGPYDLSKMQQQDPEIMEHPESPLWPDPDHTPMLHWGEPLFGYYQSEDEWVLRRHVQMFIDAGVDVLVFDTTNGYSYRPVYMKLFKILSELKNKGFKVPQFAFYMAPDRRGCGTSTLIDVWQDLYSHRYFEELYFLWKGKPLVICHDDRPMKKEIRDFFTFRKPCWGNPDLPDHWYWLGITPEARVAYNSQGEAEEFPVSVSSPHSYDMKNPGCSEAYWGTELVSRSFHDGKLDKRPEAWKYGFHFQEEIEAALKHDAPVAYVTQFNEWIVPFLTKKTNTLYGMPHWIKLQDEYDIENSRDIEPMKGGFLDNYYLQMISFIRRYKGLPQPACAERYTTIEPNKQNWPEQWIQVSPVYREYTGDTTPRYFPGYDACGIYENRTGRNEFAELRIAADIRNLYFFAKTVQPITKREGNKWMTLFLKNPVLKGKGWEGFQYVINRSGDDENASIEYSADGWNWQNAGKCRINVCGNSLMFSIPRKSLGITENENQFELEFKWADNVGSADIMEMYTDGDAAPRGRLNYLFKLDCKG